MALKNTEIDFPLIRKKSTYELRAEGKYYSVLPTHIDLEYAPAQRIYNWCLQHAHNFKLVGTVIQEALNISKYIYEKSIRFLKSKGHIETVTIIDPETRRFLDRVLVFHSDPCQPQENSPTGDFFDSRKIEALTKTKDIPSMADRPIEEEYLIKKEEELAASPSSEKNLLSPIVPKGTSEKDSGNDFSSTHAPELYVLKSMGISCTTKVDELQDLLKDGLKRNDLMSVAKEAVEKGKKSLGWIVSYIKNAVREQKIKLIDQAREEGDTPEKPVFNVKPEEHNVEVIETPTVITNAQIVEVKEPEVNRLTPPSAALERLKALTASLQKEKPKATDVSSVDVKLKLDPVKERTWEVTDHGWVLS